MRRRKRLGGYCTAWGAVAIAVSLAVLSGGAARAGNASCLWSNLSASTRTAILAAYARYGSEGLSEAPITDDLVRSLVQGCTRRLPSDDQARAAGTALAGQALAEAAAAQLRSEYGLEPRRLSAAWSGISAQDRSVVLRQFSAIELTPDDDARLYRVIRTVASDLGWRGPVDASSLSDPEFRAITDYVTGRAQAMAFAARF